MQYVLIVNINEKELLAAAETDDIKEAITREMGWVQESGIYLDEIFHPNQVNLEILDEE